MIRLSFDAVARVCRWPSLAFGLALICVAPAFSELEIPYLSGPVLDSAQLLTPAELAQLEGVIRNQLPAAQIQVWTVKSLEGEEIDQVSIRAVDKWKLGVKGKDNGALLLIAISERRMRIEVGRGLEGVVPDALAGRIVDRILKPHFRNREYAQGIQGAVEAIGELARSEQPGALKGDAAALVGHSKREIPMGILRVLFPFLFFGIILLLRILGGGGGSGFRRGGWGGGSWGGWSGRGGGGGGWGGGGGGFGGGGASGDW